MSDIDDFEVSITEDVIDHNIWTLQNDIPIRNVIAAGIPALKIEKILSEREVMSI